MTNHDDLQAIHTHTRALAIYRVFLEYIQSIEIWSIIFLGIREMVNNLRFKFMMRLIQDLFCSKTDIHSKMGWVLKSRVDRLYVTSLSLDRNMFFFLNIVELF